VQREAPCVQRRLEQRRADALEEDVTGPVGGQELARTIHDHRAVGLVLFQDDVQPFAHGAQCAGVERGLGGGGGVSGAEEQRIALAERELQGLRQTCDHAPAGHRPASLDKAQVTLRGPGLQRKSRKPIERPDSRLRTGGLRTARPADSHREAPAVLGDVESKPGRRTRFDALAVT
jgi:hypothetical protein